MASNRSKVQQRKMESAATTTGVCCGTRWESNRPSNRARALPPLSFRKPLAKPPGGKEKL